MRYGIQTLSPKFFGGAAPDIAVAGFNVGGESEAFSLRSVLFRAELLTIPLHSEPWLHDPHIRNRRRGDGGGERGHPRHRL